LGAFYHLKNGLSELDLGDFTFAVQSSLGFTLTSRSCVLATQHAAEMHHSCLDSAAKTSHGYGMSFDVPDAPRPETLPGMPSGPAPEMTDGPPDGGDRMPAAGELQIQGRRSWKTWQVSVFVLVALLLGMFINSLAGGNNSASSASSNNQTNYKLPPPSSGTTTTAAGGATATTTPASSATTTPSAASTSTTVAEAKSKSSDGKSKQAGTTTTTAASGVTTTTAPAATGPLALLFPVMQSTGNWTSTAFTVTGTPWDIGWAFECVPVPTSGPSFQISVAPAGSTTGSTTVVSETGGSGQAVANPTTTGSQQITVTAQAGCKWAIKASAPS
jgi:hypothetical protein